MSKRYQWAKWSLPLTVNPVKRNGVCVPVPDDPFHRAAFNGALLDLASAYKWADDPAHTAVLAANVWRDIIENLETCGDECAAASADEGVIDSMIRQNPNNCAQLQTSVDGVNWCEFADFSACIKDQTIQDRGPGQLPPGGTYNTCITLNARDRWLLPVPVSTGDVITVSSLAGAWSDGTVSYYCPDGSTYLLGACFATGRSHAGGDPSGVLYHMQLALNIAGVWYDPTAGPITVGAGVTNVTAWLQANDGTLADNQSAIGFCVGLVKAAIAANTWQHIFDFTTGQHNWRTANANTTYLAGQGYQAGDAAIGGGNWERSVYIGLDGASMLPATYTYIEFDFVATFGTFAVGTPAGSPEFIDMPNGTTRASVTPANGQTQVKTPAISVANPAGTYCKVFADKQASAIALTGSCIINRVILRGSGTSVDPYAAY